ncbi:MAG: hypothetical protein IJQ24_06085, partial [Synergistaceae bacterium]|nr:hypothetical protein [Synergistaceae bacterium]
FIEPMKKFFSTRQKEIRASHEFPIVPSERYRMEQTFGRKFMLSASKNNTGLSDPLESLINETE